MTDKANPANPQARGDSPQEQQSAAPAPEPPSPRQVVPLPGLAAIALYLLLLAGTIIVGVVAGRRYPPAFLVFSALFITASGGLLRLFRWAWALALAATAMLSGYNLWLFTRSHQPAGLVQGALNLIFFLYLMRVEVRTRLR
jgi:hypothetical protein